mmetsp:Transcript_3754/g.10949  ORF Transcript_3754/g.10949 Transcript_3754/m.10949 type:complete len:345 (+) Transcript_3754:332-1366(+)
MRQAALHAPLGMPVLCSRCVASGTRAPPPVFAPPARPAAAPPHAQLARLAVQRCGLAVHAAGERLRPPAPSQLARSRPVGAPAAPSKCGDDLPARHPNVRQRQYRACRQHSGGSSWTWQPFAANPGLPFPDPDTVVPAAALGLGPGQLVAALFAHSFAVLARGHTPSFSVSAVAPPTGYSPCHSISGPGPAASLQQWTARGLAWHSGATPRLRSASARASAVVRWAAAVRRLSRGWPRWARAGACSPAPSVALPTSRAPPHPPTSRLAWLPHRQSGTTLTPRGPAPAAAACTAARVLWRARFSSSQSGHPPARRPAAREPPARTHRPATPLPPDGRPPAGAPPR